MKNIYPVLFFFLGGLLSAQEFTISAELRPRFEYRHGYKSLFPDEADAAAFVSQRSRLNVAYNTENFEFYTSLQNIRVWGNVATLAAADINGISLHEAWGKYYLSPQFSFKIGRQEITYDDERMFGVELGPDRQKTRRVACQLYQRGVHRLDV
ncbi:hypothetical protein [Gramella sp. AN32]|uniref:Alginate export domain-containing protein n=1 Tax=Christiangramia antarctica TaxID=2058158 RepID=A0ABW5X7L5_9FLAO|nr:hypothetical protein [Gramella sp. AN32]